jgi:uncharacterized repeat protein (TIGR02543 family)
MRKIFRSLLVLVFGVFLISSINVKATSPLVEAIDGASIRTQGVQGLRFYATLDESVKANEHGFYLVYGKTTIAELEAAITAADGGTITLNDKTVFKVQVPGVIAGNEFSVVLLGIPEAGYFDNVSVIPYVVVDEENVYSATTVSRSVAEVALKMANAGEDISVIQGVDAITATAKKKSGYNHDDNIEISSGIYELNHKYLAVEFLKDWNEKFNLELENLEADAFYASAIVGLEGTIGTNKNLSAGNLYKFFNDTRLKAKWGWFLEYLKSVDGTTHPSRQIVAIQGDGTNGDYVLYYGLHLSYSITNFFNREHETGNYAAINFIDGTKYATIKDYNNKVYVDASKYDFHNVGDTIALPAPQEPPVGYNFSHYQEGATTYNPGTVYIIGEDTIIEVVHKPIKYDVKFYDGGNEIAALATTYDIEEGLASLPTYEKEGFAFMGWYDNPGLTGDAVTGIPAGQTGAKAFYAKLSDSAMVKYHLGDYGYHTTDKTKVVLFEEFVTDYKQLFGRGASVETLMAAFFNNSYIPEQYNIMDIFTYENNRYGWLKDHIIAVATKDEHPGLTDLNDGDQGHWRTQIEAFFTGKQITTAITTSIDFSMEKDCHNFRQYTDYGVYEVEFEPNGALFTAVKTDAQLYGFVGWYDNPDRTGDPVTVLPASAAATINLYAKWERSAFYVSFNIGYATTSPETQLVNKNAKATQPTIGDRPGYEFKGWFVNLGDANPYDFETPVTAELLLHAKWEESAAEEYNITYNYNGGHMVYATKDELINGFLEAFYAYLGLTSDLTEFKHGVGKTTGYDGTWHSEHKAKIYAGPRPTATDENYFASAAAYMETWLPFFDNIDNFVKAVNSDQFFWGAGTSTGLTRLRQWVTDIKPASYVSDATMAMMPEVPVTAVAITKGKVGVPLTLQQAYKTGATFVGWYRNADFSGEVVTVLNETNADGVTLYAKFE